MVSRGTKKVSNSWFSAGTSSQAERMEMRLSRVSWLLRTLAYSL